jgi:hypothetical protein
VGMALLCLWQGSQCLWAKPCGTHAHLNSGFAHSIEGVTTCLGWWAFVDQVTQDRCSG